MTVLPIRILLVWLVFVTNLIAIRAQQPQPTARALMCVACPPLDFSPPQVGTPAWCCGCKLTCAQVAPTCPGQFCVDHCKEYVDLCSTPTTAPDIVPDASMALPATNATLAPTPAPTPVPMPPLTLPTGIQGTTKLSTITSEIANALTSETNSISISIATTNTNDVDDEHAKRDGDALAIGAAVGGVSAFLALLIVGFIVFKIARRRRNAAGPVDNVADSNTFANPADSAVMHSARSERFTESNSNRYDTVPSIDNYQYGDGNINALEHY